MVLYTLNPYLKNTIFHQNLNIYNLLICRHLLMQGKLLENNSDIVRWSSYVGRGAIRFYLPLDGAQPNPSYAQTVIVTKNLEARQRVQTYLQKEFKENFANINSQAIHFVSLLEEPNDEHPNYIRAYNCEKQVFQKQIFLKYFKMTK